MKTLVIHPKDASTDFLKKIYDGRGWTEVNSRIPKRDMKTLIKEHDRVIILGHGTEKGLFDPETYLPLIDSNYVYLLREKQVIAIWCNADVFFLKYGLKGLYTGMIISEYGEALLECVTTTYQEIDESNLLFGRAMQEGITQDGFDLEKILEVYTSDGLNRPMDFNKTKIYKTSIDE